MFKCSPHILVIDKDLLSLTYYDTIPYARGKGEELSFRTVKAIHDSKIGKRVCSARTEVNTRMKIGVITCWYKDLSMANYSYNLQAALSSRVDLQIVSAPCVCWQRFVGKKDIFQENCEFSSFPPYLPVLETDSAPKILRPLVFLTRLLLQLLRGISYLAKFKDCDIIHYQQSSAYQFGIGPLYMLLSIPTSKKRIVTVHWLQPLNRLKFLYRSYKNADRIIVLSNGMKKIILSFGVPASKIRLVPHGASLQPLIGLPRREITFFGAPTEGKGFLTILQALKQLKDRGRKVHLRIYGIYSEAEKDKAINDAITMDVADLLVWKGRLSEADFDRKMQESMFTLAPYSSPASGSSIITRAMGNATPIIASKIGGTPEYLGRGGLLVEPDDPEALASTMTKMIDDASLRRKLSEEGRKKAETFAWDRVAEMTFEIYYECMLENRHKLRARKLRKIFKFLMNSEI